jgi:hypothetical protein
MTEYSINKCYASAVRPVVLSDWLQPWRHLSLPQLQAKALQLEANAVSAAARSRQGNTAQGGGMPRVQDPNRAKCTMCSAWHCKDAPCTTHTQI